MYHPMTIKQAFYGWEHSYSCESSLLDWEKYFDPSSGNDTKGQFCKEKE